ncbi:MAG TPA: hypothetical protein VK256_02755 [Candidatus Eisenbacteria bacterium]|nr:hypothetical protein [Candidatus Eisenbacteria bacterium]
MRNRFERLTRAAKVAFFLLVGVISGACSIGSPSTFSLNSASVDSSYTCPTGVNNAAYELHGTIDLRNGTSSRVTITSVAASMTLSAVKGGWLERVGDKYEASGVTFAPASVGAGSSASLRVTIPSACTNGEAPTAGTSYGDYSVALVVTASSGTYTIQSRNHHRLVAA